MEELLKESLREDEKLLWSGRPEAFETLDKTHKSPFIRSGIITAVVTIALCVAYVILAKANDVPLKPAVLVAAIIRRGRCRIPSGNDCILKGDHVVVVTTNHGMHELADILAD